VGAGIVTGIWVGPERTIIFHEPALASVFVGVTAGKTSLEGMSLLQLEPVIAKAKMTAVEMDLEMDFEMGFDMDLGRPLGFKVMEWLAFRRRECT
jgi:hypothetical protein